MAAGIPAIYPLQPQEMPAYAEQVGLRKTSSSEERCFRRFLGCRSGSKAVYCAF